MERLYLGGMERDTLGDVHGDVCVGGGVSALTIAAAVAAYPPVLADSGDPRGVWAQPIAGGTIFIDKQGKPA